jgi:5-methylcytosine-specific restriction protein A
MYDPLGDYLGTIRDSSVELSLDDIANLVGSLPPEAETPQFWANARNYHHSRRRQWLDNDFEAFLDRPRRIVRFIRSPTKTGDESDDRWTYEELHYCVMIYRQLWLADRQGRKVNKAQYRRDALEGPLKGRSNGSYEYRMQNISAVIDELGLPIVSGYLPRRNIGSQKALLVAIINELWERQNLAEGPTADPRSLETRVIAALAKAPAPMADPPPGSMAPERVDTSTSRFRRDPEVIAWVLRRANGTCEACTQSAPFARTDGTPYLEVHHLRQLAEGGPDIVENAIAACPNCHRRLHAGGDRHTIRRHILKRWPNLRNYPKRPIEA